ncbi:hypothetical protein [Auraticoccus monumenti]|uniref:Uncharacterized protein n=1 Tax=Auraticoccus monumenti TaxID=675864 RepID=A0A1G7ET92_9ACTN|nr:hypothetical protein [Auraticoccus monumenti]SDE66655.1 hypothetical protein SAMN04489747_4033 [Auraticoccus monumenti]
MTEVPRKDRFSLFFRLDHHITYNLLRIMGPAAMDPGRDPRAQMKKEYERRKALHEQRRAAEG